MTSQAKMIESENEKIDWKAVIDMVNEELKPYQRQGFKPTLRTMFYRLVSKGILSNTKNTYKYFSEKTAKARMARPLWIDDEENEKKRPPNLPIDCFGDDTRSTIKGFNSEYKTFSHKADVYISILKSLPEEYPKEWIPRWYKQPEHVEVWNEKAAMAGTFEAILKGRDVEIISNKGFSSLTFLYRNMKRLDKWTEMGSMIEAVRQGKKTTKPETKNIHILYFGDFDPSGEEMDKDLENRINKLTENNHTYVSFDEIDFQRIAVNREQIEEYNLPVKVDGPTLAKLEGDPRTKGFMAKYGYEDVEDIEVVELDALPAVAEDAFREFVIDSVDQYFDEDIHEKNLKDYSEEKSKELLKQKLKRLLNEMDSNKTV